jgi:hypothetical protein
MIPPKRMRKKTRNEISTGLKRAAHIRCRKFAFAPLEATASDAAICTSCVGTVCISYLSFGVVYLRNTTAERQEYTLRLGFDGGEYLVSAKSIELRQTVTFEIRELRDKQVPSQPKPIPDRPTLLYISSTVTVAALPPQLKL